MDKAGAMAQHAEQKARAVGDSISSSMAKAAFWAFAGIALSCVAGIAGGCVAHPKNLILIPVPDAERRDAKRSVYRLGRVRFSFVWLTKS